MRCLIIVQNQLVFLSIPQDMRRFGYTFCGEPVEKLSYDSLLDIASAIRRGADTGNGWRVICSRM